VITLTVNGEPHRIAPDASLADIVAEVTGRELTAEGTPTDGGRLGVAVALDASVVPRSRWSATRPAAGAEVEIITAMQGG
jgi:sulfur carrier protein